MTPEEFWEKYLEDTKQSPEEAAYSGELVFASSGITGIEQLSLVLAGKRTVSFSAFPAYEINREPVPVPGEVYIVENEEEEPSCIIELVDVKVIPFDEISWELASREGEDENLEQWRDKQREYMEEEADICGFDFDGKTPIVCEIFRVIYRK